MRKLDNSHQFIDQAKVNLCNEWIDLCIMPKNNFKISFQIDWLYINVNLKINHNQLDRFFSLFEGKPLTLSKNVIINPLKKLQKYY